MSRDKSLAVAGVTMDKARMTRRSAADNQDRSIAFRALLVVAFSLTVGSAIPALLAYHGDVFTRDEIRRKLPPVAREKVAALEATQTRLTRTITRIDDALDSVIAGSETHHRLLESRQSVSAELRAKPTPLQYYGYMGSESPSFYFPLFFLTLGVLAFIVKPPVVKSQAFKPDVLIHKRRGRLRTAILTLGIYICWQWFHWVRNFVSGEEDRTIYTYTNWDISPICFIYQELQLITISWLIATIWSLWLTYYYDKDNEIQNISVASWNDTLNPETTEQLSECFSKWQITSILLVAAFSTFFSFYWRTIQERNDHRYLISALGIHVLGIISWLIVSLPVTVTWRHWHALRARAIYELARSTDETARVELRTKLIDAVKPVGSWNLLVSATLLFASFVIPIIQMVIR